MEAKHYLSAEQYLHDIWRLAAAVRDSQWRPTVLIALWRGGAPVGVGVHEFFKACGIELRHCPLKCCSYSGIGTGANAGEVGFSCHQEVLSAIGPGDRVLVVDDVFDTGKTAAAVEKLVQAPGAEMRMACVYWKPAKCVTGGRPDYYVRDVGSDWIVFPHELEGLTREELAEKDPLLTELL